MPARSPSDPMRIARSRRGSATCWYVSIAGFPLSRAAGRLGREAEVALEGVVVLELLHARDAVGAAVPRVVARLGGIDGRARDGAEHGPGERGGLAGGADVRVHLG